MIAIFSTITGLFLVAWWLYKKQPTNLKPIYWPALTIKLLAGLAVGWLYFYHYGYGDTITYWHDGKLVGEKIISDPLTALNFFWDDSTFQWDGLINDRPRSLFFVKISGLLSFLCHGNYWLMTLIISFISFTGAWYLVVKTIDFFPGSRHPAILAFLFYPSVVFWSSGLIKESLGLGALYFLSGFLLAVTNNDKIRWWEWLVALASFWISWNLKYYWVGVFIPVAITTVLVMMIKRFKPVLVRFELSVWMGLFILLLLVATSVHPNFYPSRFFDVIWQNNQEFMALTDSDNAVYYNHLSPSLYSVLLNAPQALMAGIFRPFVWEAHNTISLIAGLENLILVILALMAIPSFPKLFKSPNRLLVLAVLIYVIILAMFLALSTPNLGTLSRYKIGFLPFLVYLLLCQNQLIIKFTNSKK